MRVNQAQAGGLIMPHKGNWLYLLDFCISETLNARITQIRNNEVLCERILILAPDG